MNWHDWTATATVIGAYLLIVLAFIAAFEVTERVRKRRDPWPWVEEAIELTEEN